MPGDQLLDAHVVGHDDAVEAPALPQDGREQLARGDAGHAVEVVVGVHDRADAGVPDGGLEREEEDVVQLPRPDVRRAPG